MSEIPPEHELGRYTGRLLLEPLPDGRRMRVIEDFGFMEADGLHWPVPPQSTVDGASIPQALWSLIGGPFEGKYRSASVVHDYYCAVRSADWRSVHRMFYRAMLVSGVSVRRAKVMYAAVYFAGPHWDDLVVKNVLLGPPAALKFPRARRCPGQVQSHSSGRILPARRAHPGRLLQVRGSWHPSISVLL